MLAAWAGFQNGPGEQQLFGGAGSPGLLPAWCDSPATQGCGEASIAPAGRGQSYTHTHTFRLFSALLYPSSGLTA